MTHEIIEHYLKDVLQSQLAELGVVGALSDVIEATMREQMLSCIYHWNDVSFRKAILVVGEEEGAFYLPGANADVRNFVVVTVRNSPIESLHSDAYQGRRLSPEEIRVITSAAIEHFVKADFSAIAEQITTLDNDKFGNLAKRYPISWAALTALAGSSRQIIRYERVPINSKPNLNNLKHSSAVNGLFFDENRSQMIHETSDGYTLTIDPGLSHILQIVLDNRLPFIGDSFKGISRNIEKLLTIMEYIMGNELGIITPNYLISNGYIERRVKLLKPGHDIEEMKRNWKNGSGVTKLHRGWLKAAVESCGV